MSDKTGISWTDATCPKCSGLGGLAAVAYAGRVEVVPPCPTCQGTGRVRSHAQQPAADQGQQGAGTGAAVVERCEVCGTAGCTLTVSGGAS